MSNEEKIDKIRIDNNCPFDSLSKVLGYSFPKYENDTKELMLYVLRLETKLSNSV